MNAGMLVRPPPAPRPSVIRPAPPRRRRRAARGAWAAAFGISLLVHLLILFVVRFEDFDADAVAAPATRLIAVRPAVGTRVEQIEVVPGDVLPDEPSVVIPPRARFDLPGLPDLPVSRDPLPADARATGASSFEELLRPGERSAELWRRTSPIHTPLDAESAARARLSGRLDAYNDSVALAAADAARAVDWTRTDEDGGRWGVSPAGIHLGDITIPVPINFSPGPGKRDEVAGRVRDWGEIQAQGDRMEGKETFEERVKAIRERKEKERAEESPPPRP